LVRSSGEATQSQIRDNNKKFKYGNFGDTNKSTSTQTGAMSNDGTNQWGNLNTATVIVEETITIHGVFKKVILIQQILVKLET
jgi:activator of HSP90 ATPase